MLPAISPLNESTVDKNNPLSRTFSSSPAPSLYSSPIPIPSSTHDMALVTTMEKAEDVKVYGSHPEHVKVADTYVRPYTTERACLDYED